MHVFRWFLYLPVTQLAEELLNENYEISDYSSFVAEDWRGDRPPSFDAVQRAMAKLSSKTFPLIVSYGRSLHYVMQCRASNLLQL